MMMKHCFKWTTFRKCQSDILYHFKWTTFRKSQSDILYHCSGFFQYVGLLENYNTEKVAVQNASFSRYP